MTDVRTKFAVLLVVLGLGGLGGFAMGSNPAGQTPAGGQPGLVAARAPVSTGAASASPQPVSTHTSGAGASVPATQAVSAPAGSRAVPTQQTGPIERD